MNLEGPGCDLLCVCPHTDDAEIALGGTLRLLADRGRRVWVADLTRGELGSNGSPDERWAEAARASAVLGLAGRLQLDFPDGFVSAEDPEQVAGLSMLIRSLRPRWLVSAPTPRRHPDHRAVVALAAKAAFMARLAAYAPPPPAPRLWPADADLPAAAARWAVEAVFSVCPPDEAPDLIFDIGGVWEAKREALACYATQFTPASGARPTMINDPAFLEEVERRARGWGFRAGVEKAEALRTDAAPVLTDLPEERWA